ncbi:MAG: mechanosensitive ion channel family protein [Nitrososphaera sp.]|nr:mechanosensitive ion channel family protein [Nitrososphaera sp.]
MSEEAAANATTSWIGIPDKISLLGTEIAPLTIVLTIAIIVAGFAIAHFSRLVATKFIGARLPHDTRKTMGRLVYFAIIAIALLSALGVSGIDLSGLFLAGGIAGIIIGFATQALFSNLISGLFLQIDKPMKVGDPVLITGKLPDVAGVVVEITTLSSRLRMFDGTYVRLPNSDVFLSEIHNYSTTAARRVEISVGVAYKENIDRVIEVIRKNVSDTPFVLVEPEPDIYVDRLGDSSVLINIWCWVPFSVWFDIRKQLIQQIKRVLEVNKIEIPFPQRVVYLAGEEKRSARSTRSQVTPQTGEVRKRLELDEYSKQQDD